MDQLFYKAAKYTCVRYFGTSTNMQDLCTLFCSPILSVATLLHVEIHLFVLVKGVISHGEYFKEFQPTVRNWLCSMLHAVTVFFVT